MEEVREKMLKSGGRQGIRCGRGKRLMEEVREKRDQEEDKGIR